ncbi:DUF423 domain-containing protein [Methylocystis parvus]|uniref:DUF423 domain-containing protein n=1 Tax=Methylocystis parvus TaxID=134 RepID=A0A6B8M5J5_9HYPH|nr:DUF423 domain-containing protein [Methylocystis parvus]QGM99254.1 DUF423 domain-containing protein [Methylocystis parvus]WBK00364.1 DUF423 domain-containing protein [Methylocystis parvus OBBP]
MKTPSIVATVAALQGAAGVALAAAAAHVDANPLLSTASQFLTLHAAAGLALAALARTAPAYPRFLSAATFLLQAGVTLFSADLAARVYLGGKLFPFAAPMGGSATILAWLALAVWGALGIARRG